jgi:hypothetical protein
VSALLNHLGINASHERVFLPDHRRPWGDLDGDVSWFAVPFLHEIALEEISVIHLVRHPIRCAQSYAGLRFFHDTRDEAALEYYHGAVWRYDKAVYDSSCPHDRFAAFWVRWNLATEPHACARLRIEDLRSNLGVARLLSAIGRPRSISEIDKAIGLTDPATNHREPDDSVQLESFSAPMRRLLRFAAERYGYWI